MRSLILALALGLPAVANAGHLGKGDLVSGTAIAIDGETLVVAGTELRLFGIDAPAISDERGPFSRASLDGLILGKTLRCDVIEPHAGGSTLAVCSAGLVADLGLKQLSRGRAVVDRDRVRGTRFAPHYDTAERVARDRSRGIWARPGPPWYETFQESIAIILVGVLGFGGVFLEMQSAHASARRLQQEQHDQAKVRDEETQRDERVALASLLAAEFAQQFDRLESVVARNLAAACSDKAEFRLDDKEIIFPPTRYIYEAHLERLIILEPELVRQAIRIYTNFDVTRSDINRLFDRAKRDGKDLAPAADMRHILIRLSGNGIDIGRLSKVISRTYGFRHLVSSKSLLELRKSHRRIPSALKVSKDTA